MHRKGELREYDTEKLIFDTEPRRSVGIAIPARFAYLGPAIELTWGLVDSLEDLLKASAKGDEAAFAALYDAAAPQLFGLALRILKRRDWAEDVLQEALLAAWRHATDYQQDLGSAKAWLCTIVRNRALDRLRRESKTRTVDGDDALPEIADESPSPLENALAGSSARQLHNCLEALEAAQKRAILLAYFEGLTHEELALRLKSPLGTVKIWIRRGLLKLKGCLEP
jgi:RNA polymerase sigma-70 factor (ECF subfamily)